MNDLTPLSSVTMTSLEIAELVESSHSDVKRSIERLANRRIMDLPGTIVVRKGKRGPNSTTYVFSGDHGRRDCYIVVAQLSPRHMGAVIDAWGRTESTLKDLLFALEAFDVPEDMTDMYVYAIRESETGRIKLGISRNPAARVEQLQTGNSQHLELMAFCKAQDRFSDEFALHARASQYHIRGEWFDGRAIGVMQ